MVNTKNTDLVGLREILRAHGPSSEPTVLARVSPQAKQLYETALAFQWSPLPLQMEAFVAAADVLFPGDSEAAYRLGRALAEKAYGGVYKAFLRIPSTSFVLSRGVHVWGSYYDTGTPSIENERPGAGRSAGSGKTGERREGRERTRSWLASA